MISDETARTEDLRLSRRFAVNGFLEVSWLDRSGKLRVTRSRVLDISEDGIAIELPEPVMPLMVQFQSDRCKVNGKAFVRYCRRAGKKYVAGLQFAGDLHWRAPQGHVRKPIPLCSDPESRVRGLVRALWRILPRNFV